MHGTLVASASDDRHIRLWRLSDQETIAIFDHSCRVNCVTFSIDGRRILGGGEDKKISVWAVPEDALLEDALEEPASNDDVPCTSYFSPSLHHLISRKDDTPNEQASNKDAPNSEQLHQQRSEAEGAIQMAIDTHLDNAPLRLLHTTTGLLCDRQAPSFEKSTPRKWSRRTSVGPCYPIGGMARSSC
ncbi:uncharacterized protein EDB91DRAFT_1173215 [Suillus paluster]|uniref:uncharacterized protein n=1 Tax=Suillus paluster TaxID=48578 RepID=UPI001B86E78F|nr:uncharacterized protein EDB91DRAFT_1173215 [Suillus paluster]KAG1723257.1 hypothetical protein EDB91DRAFT_1173215 [Suillus paluster]